jgi:hypothetical protein
VRTRLGVLHSELNLWMLNLVAHYVAEEESWMDSADDANDWGSLLLNGDWEMPPPVWAKSRAREQVLEEKEIVPLEEKKEKTEVQLTVEYTKSGPHIF